MHPILTIWAFIRQGYAHLAQRPATQIPILDVLRSLAIVLVVCDHTSAWWRDFTGRDLPLAKFPIFYFGWTGVDLFFILSGYLIGFQIWREVQRTGSVRFGRFMLRRGLRIWPLYICFAAIVPLARGMNFQASDWLFLSNYIDGAVSGGWSLSTEEQFYLVFPLAVLIAASLPVRLHLWGIILIACLLLVEFARWKTAGTMFAEGVSVAAVKDALYAPAHLHCEALIVGALIALVAVVRPALLAAVRSRRGVLATGLFLCGGLALTGVIHRLDAIVFPFLALAILFGTCLVVSLRMRQASVVRRLGARSTTFYQMSRLSFGVYLGHFYIVRGVIALLGPVFLTLFGDQGGFLVALVAGTVLSFGLATVTFVLIEQPFLTLRDRLLSNASGGYAAVANIAAPLPPQEV